MTKLSATGSVLVYSTYLGGSEHERPNGIAVDAAGDAYITGCTESTDFPTANPFQGALSSSGASSPYRDAFVTKLNPRGDSFVYSTYLGGQGINDCSAGVAVDKFGNAYVAGQTDSSDFPTRHPLQSTKGLFIDAFVAKLDPWGSTLVYSTFLGGSDSEWASDIAVDRPGNVYVAGHAGNSPDFPTSNPFQPKPESTEGGRRVSVLRRQEGAPVLLG